MSPTKSEVVVENDGKTETKALFALSGGFLCPANTAPFVVPEPSCRMYASDRDTCAIT